MKDKNIATSVDWEIHKNNFDSLLLCLRNTRNYEVKSRTINSVHEAVNFNVSTAMNSVISGLRSFMFNKFIQF